MLLTSKTRGMGKWLWLLVGFMGAGFLCLMAEGGRGEDDDRIWPKNVSCVREEVGSTRSRIGKESKAAASLSVEDEARGEQRSGLTYEIGVYAGVGQFLAVLKIGTPPVSFTAIVDTGSDLVWRQCRPCKHCYPQADYGFPIFDPALSSTFLKAPCGDPLCQLTYGGTCSPSPDRTCSYSSPYDDPPAFTRGDLAFDTLSLSDSSGRRHLFPHFAFGCSHESRGPYNFAGSGGIVGFGQGNLSLPSQLRISRFSYCLQRTTPWSIYPSDRPLAMATSHTSLSPFLASPLLLGDDAHLGASTGIQSTRILDRDSYFVDLHSIRVAGRRLRIPRSLFRDGGTLIDSGTTFTTLPTAAFRAVSSAFKALIPLTPWQGGAVAGPRNLSLCYSSLPSPVPSLSFHFKGAHLRLAPHNYFVFIENLYCLAVLESRDSGSGVVYGNVQQQDFHILYDLHSQRISFKRTSCSSLQHNR